MLSSGADKDWKSAMESTPRAAQAMQAGSDLMVGIASLAGVGAATHDEFGNRMARLPGIGCDAAIDDSGATIVLVLPKVLDESADKDGAGSGRCVGSASSDDDGSMSESLVDQPPRVDEPLAMARTVFLREQPLLRELVLTESQASMPQADYQTVLRKGLKHVIMNVAGLEITSFDSIDGDMVFWKVTASKARLQELAQECDYVMPYCDKAYTAVGMEAPKIDSITLRAYGKYVAEHAFDFEEFRSMDAVRLVVAALSGHIKLHALHSQRVIERWFPAAQFDEMQGLTNNVVGWPLAPRFLCLPQDGDADFVRSYFGEEIASFFSLFYTLVKSKRALVVVATAVSLVRRYRPMGITIIGANSILAVFGCMIVIWGMWFVSNAEHVVAMDRLRWGSDGRTRAEVHMSDYEPKNRGHWKQGIFAVAGKVITALFLVVVVITCTGIALRAPNQKIATTLQIATTFGFSFIWGKIAKTIVQLENKRTQADFNRALTMRLSFVKLFIFFTPLLRLAFLAPSPPGGARTTLPTSQSQHRKSRTLTMLQAFLTTLKNWTSPNTTSCS